MKEPVQRFASCYASLAGMFGLLTATWLCLQAQERSSGSVSKMTVSVGGLERECLVHIPKELPAGKAVPLVFVYHGGNGDAKGTMNLSKFNPIADREKFIVVYPQGVGKSWNDGRVTKVSQAHRDNIDDIAFFDEMLVKLFRDYNVDGKRVFVTGISNGGIFSHYVAANRSEKIAAIAPVVGGIAEPFDKKFKPSCPVSVLIIQGYADPLVPYNGGKVAGGDGKDRGSIIGTDNAAKLWVEANGCKAEPKTDTLPDRDPSDECRVEATQWNDGNGDSEVWLYCVRGGGHTWPDGLQYLPRAIIGRVTHDIDSETIWHFFNKHAKL